MNRHNNYSQKELLSREYTENKKIVLSTMGNGYYLLKILLVFNIFFAIWLMITLLNFSPFDTSWLQIIWFEPVFYNIGGVPGAWTANMLFFVFGVVSYIIPLIIIGNCWFVWRCCKNNNYIDHFLISFVLHLIGIIVLILTSCILAAISMDNTWYFASGGIIGILLKDLFQFLLYDNVCIIALICIWTIGLTLFTGYFWIKNVEKISNTICSMLAFIDRCIYYYGIYIGGKDKYNNSDKILFKTNHRLRCTIAPYSTLALCKFIIKKLINLLGYKSRTVFFSDKYTNRSSVPLKPYKVTTDSNSVIRSSGNIMTQLEHDKHSLLLLNNPPVIEPTSCSASISSIKIRNATTIEMMAQRQLSELTNISLGTDIYSTIQQNKYQYFPENKQLMTKNNKYFPELVNVSVKSTPKKSVVNMNLTSNILSVTSKITRSSTVTAGANVSTPISNIVTDTRAHLKIKNGIGPQLPRPNRVRVPTRRELAFCGIKMSLQQMKKEKLPHIVGNGGILSRICRFLLTHRFSVLQRKSYFNEQSTKKNLVPLSNFNFSSTKGILDNAMNEPTFIPSVISDSRSSEKKLVSLTSHIKFCHLITQKFMRRSPNILVHQKKSGQSNQLQLQLQRSIITNQLLVKDSSNNLLMKKPTALLPSLNLLMLPPVKVEQVDTFALERMARLIEARLADFRIKANVVNYSLGPVITRFELNLAPGVKAARISSLSRDLARSLSIVSVRVVEVIPGKPYVGLELSNKKRETVYLREVLNNTKFHESQSPLTIVLGKDIVGDPVVADLAKMPHLLVAGTTGSGKSVSMNAMILSILYKASPDDVRFIMIDPKILELSAYDGIPHLLTKVITDMKDAASALRWSIHEMERRYKLMSVLGVRNLAGYNEKITKDIYKNYPIPSSFRKVGNMVNTPQYSTPEKLPYIVVLVDEFADLMMTVRKEVEGLIARLAQKARAAGIHLILATQRPSVDVITGLIKANIPTRIAFTVSSKIDSRTIINQSGAELLLGMGDMLYSGPDSTELMRVHGAFVHDSEVHAVVQDWKSRNCSHYDNSSDIIFDKEK